MGFPGLEAVLAAAEDSDEQNPNKQTLFGFPSQKGNAPSEASEVQDLRLADPRGTIAGFAIDGEPSDPTSLPESEPGLEGPRSTTFGLPAINATKPPQLQETPGDEEDDDDDDGSPRFGTMVGMNVSDILAKLDPDDATGTAKTTQFAMPAFNPSSVSEVAEEPSAPAEIIEHREEASTLSWNPLTDDLGEDSEAKRAVLQKLREASSASQDKKLKPLPSTGQKKSLPKPGGLGAKLGLSVPKPKGAGERSEPMRSEVSDADQSTGVLRRAGTKRRPPHVSESGPVLGSYVVNKSDLTADDLNEPSDFVQHDAPTQESRMSAEPFQAQPELEPDAAADLTDQTRERVSSIAEVTSSTYDPWGSDSTTNDEVSEVSPTADTVGMHAVPGPKPEPGPNEAVATTTDTGERALPQQAPPGPIQAQEPSRSPTTTEKAEADGSEEKLLRRIQMLFGAIATAATLAVAAAAAIAHTGGLGWIVIGATFVIGLLSGFATIAPFSLKVKSLLFGLSTAGLIVSFVMTLVFIVPYSTALIFAALVTLLAVVFPMIGRALL